MYSERTVLTVRVFSDRNGRAATKELEPDGRAKKWNKSKNKI